MKKKSFSETKIRVKERRKLFNVKGILSLVLTVYLSMHSSVLHTQLLSLLNELYSDNLIKFPMMTWYKSLDSSYIKRKSVVQVLLKWIHFKFQDGDV